MARRLNPSLIALAGAIGVSLRHGQPAAPASKSAPIPPPVAPPQDGESLVPKDWWRDPLPLASPSAPEPAAPARKAAPANKPARRKLAKPTEGKFTPTGEQHDIVQAAVELAPGQTLKIIAYAGAGKTSTARLVATEAGFDRGLYIAFNKIIAEEARRSFPSSVECRTLHSLAWRAHALTVEEVDNSALAGHAIRGAVAGVVGNRGGVVSGLFNEP